MGQGHFTWTFSRSLKRWVFHHYYVFNKGAFFYASFTACGSVCMTKFKRYIFPQAPRAWYPSRICMQVVYEGYDALTLSLRVQDKNHGCIWELELWYSRGDNDVVIHYFIQNLIAHILAILSRPYRNKSVRLTSTFSLICCIKKAFYRLFSCQKVKTL